MKHPVALGLAAALLVGIVATLAFRLVATPSRSGTVGEVDPVAVWATVLPDLAGRPQALAQWRGQVIVLNFWAPWCPPCREEIPGFIRLHARHADQGLRFVGIALDTPDKVAAYVDQAGIPYPILLGAAEGALLARAAGNALGGLPYTVVFDRQGHAVATLTGALDEARLASLVAPLL
ncbi:MAG: TlpA family protein disulfide reductase [Pseudomonadota bacterium]